jgi:hypothetical protein
MNLTEKKYSEHLEQCKQTGVVLFWEYEAITFKIAKNTRFTPDFLVQMSDGTIEFHEVKACKANGQFLAEDDAIVKIKVAQKLFPMFGFVFCGCLPKNNGWKFRQFFSEEENG